MHDELFNEKAMAVYKKPEFGASIYAYIAQLSELLRNSSVLSERFTDRSAETLGKALIGNNLFEAISDT